MFVEYTEQIHVYRLLSIKLQRIEINNQVSTMKCTLKDILIQITVSHMFDEDVIPFPTEERTRTQSSFYFIRKSLQFTN